MSELGTAAPVVGITTYGVHADWTVWRDDSVLTPRTYVDAVLAAGGAPLLLPCIAPEHVVDRYLDLLDAVMLIGGEDICGIHSGREESVEVHAAHSDVRDAFELALARGAWERDLPVLGICRGAQLLNVARGGTIIEDLPGAGASRDHLVERGVFNDHQVALLDGTLGASLLGSSTAVPSHHRQAVDRLGEGLLVSGRAEDGVVEAIEAEERRFVLGVQWHPEEGDDPTLFEALVEAKQTRRV